MKEVVQLGNTGLVASLFVIVLMVSAIQSMVRVLVMLVGEEETVHSHAKMVTTVTTAEKHVVV